MFLTTTAHKITHRRTLSLMTEDSVKNDKVDEFNEQHILKAINKDFKELKNEAIVYVGGGTYASAYRVGDKVFKITDDIHDAIMNQEVMKGEYNKIVKVHKVYKIEAGLFLIVADYVRYHWDEYFSTLKIPSLDTFNFYRAYQFYLRERDLEETRNFILDRYAHNEGMRDQFLELLDEIVELQFTNLDFHEENVRFDEEGNMKVIDLGHRTSGGRLSNFEEL